MNQNQGLVAWRTVLTALVVVLLQLGGFIFAVRHGMTGDVATAYGQFCFWSTTVALGQAARSTVQQLAQGSGVKGLISTLMTDAKPGEAPEVAKS